MITPNPAAFPCYTAPFLKTEKSETPKDRISLINHQADDFFLFSVSFSISELWRFLPAFCLE